MEVAGRKLRPLDTRLYADLVHGGMVAGDAARWLGISEEKFRKLAPQINRSKLGGRYVYFPSDLHAYALANREEVATPVATPAHPPAPVRTTKPNSGRKKPVERLI